MRPVGWVIFSGFSPPPSDSQQRISGASPVFFHDQPGPFRLTDIAARFEAPHAGLEVQHRRTVYGIQAADPDMGAGDFEYLADGDAQMVGSVLAALREYPHLGPVRVATRMARLELGLGRVGLVERIDHQQMREGTQSRQGLRGEPGGVQFDAALHRIPSVVDRVCAAAPDVAYRLKRDAHGRRWPPPAGVP